MDPKDIQLILASFAAGISGAGALFVSLQELQVHRQQVSLQADDVSLRARVAEWEIRRDTCTSAREIFAMTRRNPAVAKQISDALTRSAAQKLLGCIA